MARSWDFQGKLKENGQQVISEIECNVDTGMIEEPDVQVERDNGKAIIDITIPKSLLEKDTVGRFTIVDTDIQGEIFNDYGNNEANGLYSHVIGENNKANYPNQFVAGKYNENKENDIMEIGGGTFENRHNILELDNTGNLKVNSVKVNDDIYLSDDVSLQEKLDSKIDDTNIEDYLKKAEALIFGNKNDAIIEVGSTNTTICSIDFITKEETTPIFMMTIPVTMDLDGNVIISYYLDDELLSNDTMTHYCNKGENLITLVNLLEPGENFNGNLKVKMKTSYVSSDIRNQDCEIKRLKRTVNGTGGPNPEVDTTIPSATIRAYGIRSALYVQGIGLSDAWSARLTIADIFATRAIRKLDKIIFIPYIDDIFNLSFENLKKDYIFANENYWNCDLTLWDSNEDFFKMNKIITYLEDGTRLDTISIESNDLSLDKWISQDKISNSNGYIEELSIGKFGQNLTSAIIENKISNWDDSIDDIDYDIIFSLDKSNLYNYNKEYFTIDKKDLKFHIKNFLRLKDKKINKGSVIAKTGQGRISIVDFDKEYNNNTISFIVNNNKYNKIDKNSIEITNINNPINSTNITQIISSEEGIVCCGDFKDYAKINDFSLNNNQEFKKYYCYHNFGTIITSNKMNFSNFYVLINYFKEITLNSNMVFKGTLLNKKENEEIISYVDIPIKDINKIKDISLRTFNLK